MSSVDVVGFTVLITFIVVHFLLLPASSLPPPGDGEPTCNFSAFFQAARRAAPPRYDPLACPPTMNREWLTGWLHVMTKSRIKDPSAPSWTLEHVNVSAARRSVVHMQYKFTLEGQLAMTYLISYTPFDLIKVLENNVLPDRSPKIVIMNSGIWSLAGRKHSMVMQERFAHAKLPIIGEHDMGEFLAGISAVLGKLTKQPLCTFYYREMFVIKNGTNEWDPSFNNGNVQLINKAVNEMIRRHPTVNLLPSYDLTTLSCCKFYDCVHPYMDCNLLLWIIFYRLDSCCRTRENLRTPPVYPNIYIVGDSTARLFFGFLVHLLIKRPLFFSEMEAKKATPLCIGDIPVVLKKSVESRKHIKKK